MTHAFRPEVQVAADGPAAARAAAQHLVAAARRAIDARGSFRVALTGGSTPLLAYAELARSHSRSLDWSRVHFFMGDERLVPYDDPRSNWGAARLAWLGKLDLPADRLHPMPVDLDDDTAARDYERELRTHAPEGLDLVLLGLGEDGHTASLFPGRIGALPPARWVVAARAPATSPVERRLTLTFAAFAAASEVLFQVSGAAKSPLVADVLAGRGNHPAGLVRARERCSWILDAAAARQHLSELNPPSAS
ncbi:MAG: 6-phosphogluconolactonase [Planctomycetes bacterium]|nr:6-phosphogluconolactonase [Planctomycetota bacterium]